MIYLITLIQFEYSRGRAKNYYDNHYFLEFMYYYLIIYHTTTVLKIIVLKSVGYVPIV